MFKAVKMKRLKFLLLSFALGCAMLAGAQTPEVFPLWPQGVKENNGIKVDRTVDDQGGISNNSTAELLVFHPDPAKNTGKAVLICPGGGYTYLAMGYEGEEFAQWLVKQGITGIVLKYRMPNQHDRIPMTDALRAMKWIRSRSEEWGIDPATVGIAGFSAGGHLACCLGVFWDGEWLYGALGVKPEMIRPDGMILCYPVITSGEYCHKGSFECLMGAEASKKDEKLRRLLSLEYQVGPQVPKTFLWHTWTDQSVPVENSLLLLQALRKAGVNVEAHLYPVGPHGIALGTEETQGIDQKYLEPYCDSWMGLAIRWIEKQL